jgi:hypothetical protein
MTACRLIILCAIAIFGELAFDAYVIVHHGVTAPVPLTTFGLAVLAFGAALWWIPKIVPFGRARPAAKRTDPAR